LSAGKRKVKMN